MVRPASAPLDEAPPPTSLVIAPVEALNFRFFVGLVHHGKERDDKE